MPEAGSRRPGFTSVLALPKRADFRLFCLSLLACLVAGCASPLVEYLPITGEDKDGLVKFRFAESMIVFNFGKTTAGIANPNTIIISSVPIPHGQQKYGISGTGFWQNWGVVTLVNVSFRGDSDLIQQLTVSVSDERQQAIQTLGSIAGVVGGLLSVPSAPTQTLPKGISVTAFLANIPRDCEAKQGRDGWIHCTDLALDGTGDFTADISIEPRPIDALPASILSKPLYSSNFFYSACRQMTITLKPSADQGRSPVSATVAVADPLYLQTLRIPPKGAITVAPSCGANSTSEDPNLPTAIDYLNTLATQAKAVKQSLIGSNRSGASKN